VAAISTSLQELQRTAASLDAEPCIDGLLTAFQQLSLIKKQIQQELVQCKKDICVKRVLSNPKRKLKRVDPVEAAAIRATAAAARAAAEAQVAAQVAALTQLRGAADDAQDFLLSLLQQLLQVCAGAVSWDPALVLWLSGSHT
jgi:hypothetical protein